MAVALASRELDNANAAMPSAVIAEPPLKKNQPAQRIPVPMATYAILQGR